MDCVKIENFSYAYEKKHVVLNNLSLTVPQGSFLGIIGRSGAGKTTLCHSIAGLIPHYFGGSLAGRIEVLGRDTQETPLLDLAAHTGVVLQDYESQLISLTVEEEIAFSLENQGMPREQMAERIQTALKTVGLSEKMKSEIATLSGGQKQRLVIAAALATRPSLLVLDEPSSALDPEGVQHLYQLLDQMRRESGMTIVIAEHRTEQLAVYADQIVLLQNGAIAACGSPYQVFQMMAETDTFPEALPPQFIISHRLGLSTLKEEAIVACLRELFDTEKTGEPIAYSA